LPEIFKPTTFAVDPFNLRGNENVEIETGLLAIAMNLKKMAG
jgi:hypothetical protein